MRITGIYALLHVDSFGRGILPQVQSKYTKQIDSSLSRLSKEYQTSCQPLHSYFKIIKETIMSHCRKFRKCKDSVHNPCSHLVPNILTSKACFPGGVTSCESGYTLKRSSNFGHLSSTPPLIWLRKVKGHRINEDPAPSQDSSLCKSHR